MIINGDCLEVMKTYPDNHFSGVITDPPYFLINKSGSGFMGKPWDSLHELDKYLWLNNSFVNFAINLLNVLQVDRRLEEGNTVRLNVNIKELGEKNDQTENVLSAKSNSLSQNARKKDSALLLVLTKQEVSDWLNELSPNHTKTLESFLSGVKSDASFVIPISWLNASVIKNTAHKIALPKLKAETLGAKEILVSSTDLAGIKNAIEVMIGTRCAKQFINATTGHADAAINIVEERRFNVITSSHIERADLTTWITSLLCAINATSESSTIPNYLISNFYIQAFREVYRICKPGSHVLAFGGTRTFHILTAALEQCGFEIRDVCNYLYGSGFPKSHNFGRSMGGDWSGFGTALKPAWEPIIVAMKPLEGTFLENASKWGVAGLNIDASRIGTDDTRAPTYSMTSKGIEGGGFGTGKMDYSRDGQIAGSSCGRWPSNLLLDESAAQQLDQMTGTLKSGAVAPTTDEPHRGIYEHGRSVRNVNQFDESSGGASRFFYCAKASSSERNEGCEDIEEVECQTGCGGAMPVDDEGKQRDRFKKKAHNNHPTVKPLKLMQYLLTLICPPNGKETQNTSQECSSVQSTGTQLDASKKAHQRPIILDPFAGSGSTCIAAKRLGIECVGIEKYQEYCEIANARIAA